MLWLQSVVGGLTLDVHSDVLAPGMEVPKVFQARFLSV